MDEQHPSTPPDNNPASRNQAGQRRNKTAGTGNDMSNFVFGKVQPQALTLEEAVLGAIMLDKDTLPIILDILKPESFYSDIHQLIYRAMLGLFDKSHPIDLLTVTEELKKSGDLEKIGGPYFLVELTNRVASAANIEYHARIIAQKHIQRELIRVSTQIIRDAYEDTTDVFNLMDDAERGLFAITEHNLTRSFESMGSLSSKLLKQIEDLSKRKDGLTGVPTGFVELDRMTSGWQPSDLIIMAARPGMGKTSFVLSVARNAALEFGKPVALFSLEMSNLQLVQRLVSMESEVPATKLRNGQLEDYEWTMIQQTIEKLSTAPIFIDDTPGINIFELRAKCRRLKMQHNIELIIIDYLQLMSGTGEGGRGGNREQEVSNISRSLKGLAKELGVPVIALSQLSRAVETRGGTKRPQLSDLRESGCLAGDTLVFNALTGGTVPIKDLAEQWEQDMNFHCLALNNDLKLTPRPVIKAFYSGQKEVFEITTATGRKIKASANHPFLKLTGWTRLDQLSVGDRLAVPRKYNINRTDNPLSKSELILLAHLIGDGCILPKQPYHYTSADTKNIEIVNQCSLELFGIKGRVSVQKNWYHTHLPSPYHLTHNKKHPITTWYEKLNISRVRSYEKTLPATLFECDDYAIGVFLHHLWATDGNISWKKTDHRKANVAIYYASSSWRLAQQVQHLLLRLDMVSTIRTSKKGNYRPVYQVHITNVKDSLSFLEKVGCYGSRGDIIPELILQLKQIDYNPNNDVIPIEVWKNIIEPIKVSRDISWREFSKQIGVSYSGSSLFKHAVGRERMERIHAVLPDPSVIKLATSDIYWDKILSIEPLGIEDVYDLTVPEDHNFVANDFIVHNSIEQDADIVTFIYRPEYYNILEDEEGNSMKGVAEILIAKHRNGSLGTVKLRFIDRFAKFDDLDDPHFNELPFDAPKANDAGDSNASQVITRSSRMNDEDIPF